MLAAAGFAGVVLRAMRRALPILSLGVLASALLARADVAPEKTGAVARTPDAWGAHFVWVGDQLLHRSVLFDADTGRMLGSIYGGDENVAPVSPVTSAARREVYLASTYYTRRMRGERSDVLTVHDAGTLAPTAEVALPPRKADYANGLNISALLDDGRFVAVFNQTPASSVSIVDVEQRRFAGEIETGGCALVYPAGPRRFGMLCVDGSVLAVTLDENGAEASRAKSDKFFDAESDPVMEKAVRVGPTKWLYVSFEGMAHEVDFAGVKPHADDAWSLFSDADRAAKWRVGGVQLLAYHAASGELYALVHQGEKDTHKDGGTEAWVYDLAKRERVRSVAAPNLRASYLRRMFEIEAGGWIDWALAKIVPSAGVKSAVVTQDGAPLLFLADGESPVLSVHDARTGAKLREIAQTGISMGLVVLP